MGVCIKGLGETVPLGQVVFFRSAVALVPLALFQWWFDEFPRGLATRRPLGHVARSLMGACAMFTSFATIRPLPLAEATLLSYLSPVLLALLAWSLLGERLSRRRIGGIVLGLCGGAAFVLPAVSGDLTERASSALERGSRPPF
ncbi:DMT family transporter [Jiella pelagia]|uniref:DMT family transporter n=1 Tax=Jiella pelagia TaxID=2986949 RepID=A0ABY7CBJ7_9HYPH|nr:DMT family transporter [Jiella pelagia]WAP71135.1 DMT family transporter [Jiella pelagia]